MQEAKEKFKSKKLKTEGFTIYQIKVAVAVLYYPLYHYQLSIIPCSFKMSPHHFRIMRNRFLRRFNFRMP
jgi:hypothetical protein